MSTDTVDHNAARRREALARKMARQQAWARQVAAQVEIRRRRANIELAELGLEPIEFQQQSMEKVNDPTLQGIASMELPGNAKDDA
jgi:hypothetical protein